MSKVSRQLRRESDRDAGGWGKWEERSHLYIPHPRMASFRAAFVNHVMSVQISDEDSDWGLVTHLWVRRHDKTPTTWAELMRVKNELVGPERVGVEVIPPVSQLIDDAMMFHVFVLPEGFALPFGLHLRKKAGVR